MVSKETYRKVLAELMRAQTNLAHERLILADMIERLEAVSPDEVNRLYACGHLDLQPSLLVSSASKLLKDILENDEVLNALELDHDE